MATDMTLVSDPAIAAVLVRENGEPVRDAAGEQSLRVDSRESGHNPAHRHIRAGLLARLLVAQAGLPAGLHLLLIEGYRPPPLQRSQFEAYRAELALRFPNWAAERLRRETSKFISPPEVAPHCTGGAIDLTLCTESGGELEMGTAINASPLASANRCYTAAEDIPAEAQANRRVLRDALTGAGLVNYPTEWWHWSYGDRYWAHATGQDSCYGPLSDGLLPESGGSSPAGLPSTGYSRTAPKPSRLNGS